MLLTPQPGSLDDTRMLHRHHNTSNQHDCKIESSNLDANRFESMHEHIPLIIRTVQ